MADSPAPQPEQLRFAPYAQLVNMLVPSAGTIALYGPGNELLWCSEGSERPDLRELIDRLKEAAPGSGTIEQAASGPAAFLSPLEGEDGTPVGTLVVELADATGASRLGMIESLLKPVVDCLQSRLAVEQSQPAPRERGLEAFAELIDEDDTAGEAAVGRLLDSCVDSMSVHAAALFVPEAHVEAVASSSELDSETAAGLVAGTKQRLLAWLEHNDRLLLDNRAAEDGATPPHKIVACPVRDQGRRIKGFIALYRVRDGEDFALHDTAVLESLASKVSMLLNRQHDPLTGLRTRAAFEAQAQALLDSSTSRDALLYVDVDHLHQVNEAFGFDCGDRVLSFVAGHIRSLLEPDHVCGRLGGDRFAVMLPGTGLEDARGLAERLQAVLRESDYTHDEQAIPVSVTIGVAEASERSVRHLLAAAELSSKRAKQRGPARIATSPRRAEAQPAAEREQFAYKRFEDALADNALCLEAQPIIGLAAEPGRLLGFEILVRMRNASGEWLSAHRFLSAAEYYGMMPAIDRWVVGSTLEKIQALGDALPELPLGISVNVSVESLKSGGYPRFVLDMLGRSRVPTGLVSFELKGSVAWSHIEHADRFVRTLSAAGSRVALDNFGSGASAIAQLRALPIGYVKIDGALLRRSLEDAESAGLVEGLTRAAQAVGIKTVAEQVETEALASTLKALQVDYAQGYHFGQPAPLEDWLGRLGSHGPQAALAR